MFVNEWKTTTRDYIPIWLIKKKLGVPRWMIVVVVAHNSRDFSESQPSPPPYNYAPTPTFPAIFKKFRLNPPFLKGSIVYFACIIGYDTRYEGCNPGDVTLSSQVSFPLRPSSVSEPRAENIGYHL